MNIKFFAHLKTLTGCEELELTVEGKITQAALWAMLIARFPGLAAHQASTRLAVNCAYEVSTTMLEDRDEVALIPPVSGG